MKKKGWILTILAGLLVVSGIVSFILVLSPSTNFDPLVDHLAKILHTNRNYLTITIPPRYNRYPGTLIVPYEGMEFLARATSSTDPILRRSSPVPVKTRFHNKQDIEAILENLLGENEFSLSGSTFVELEVSDSVTVETEASNLKEIIKKDYLENGYREKTRLEAQIISKAFEGTIRLVVHSDSSKSSDSLLELKKLLDESEIVSSTKVKVAFLKSESDALEIVSKQPIVYAYESVGTKFAEQTLGDEPQNEDFELVDLTSADIEKIRGNNDREKETATSENKRWGLVLVANGYFEKYSKLDRKGAIASVSRVRKSLSKFQPTFVSLIESSRENPLSAKRFLDQTVELSMYLLSNPVDYLVVYYLGHGLTLKNGEMVFPFTNITAEQISSLTSRNSVTVETDEFDALNGKTLYDAVTFSGVPTTLVLDACFEHEGMIAELNGLGFTPSLDYFGDADIMTGELGQISNLLKRFGSDFQYRTAKNPVVFSAKPGLPTELTDDPESVLAERIGPLAARIARSVMYNTPLRNDTLSKILYDLADLKSGIGEITTEGTITWSDFEVQEEILGKVTYRY